MTATVTIEVDAELHGSITQAIAARDAGMAQAEDADHSGWDKALIDTAIQAFADTGRDFSANDVRELLPSDVRQPLMGARFSCAAVQQRIQFRGYITSTKKNTHSKRIALWRGSAQSPQESA